MRILKIFIRKNRKAVKAGKELPLMEHLEELRKRLLFGIAAVIVFSVISFIFIDKILAFITVPVGRLVFINPTEAFMSKIKLAFSSGIFFAVPALIYQAWKFISPALFDREKRYVYWVLPSACLLFLFGVSFAFFGVLPVGLKFLLAYGAANIQAMISITSYINFISIFLLSFGIVFQIPIVVIFLSKLGIVTPGFLKEKRKYAILIIFIAAAILTPGPDIFSQVMMAVPLLLLYEVSIFLSKYFGPQRKQTTYC
ncbi:MAG: twin-arginine translocase subunit TatC [Ruminiclostridium sp.]|nr:twin-arginine translocase subunit TatC [Ruminiclostridium sp.]